MGQTAPLPYINKFFLNDFFVCKRNFVLKGVLAGPAAGALDGSAVGHRSCFRMLGPEKRLDFLGAFFGLLLCEVCRRDDDSLGGGAVLGTERDLEDSSRSGLRHFRNHGTGGVVYALFVGFEKGVSLAAWREGVLEHFSLFVRKFVEGRNWRKRRRYGIRQIAQDWALPENFSGDFFGLASGFFFFLGESFSLGGAGCPVFTFAFKFFLEFFGIPDDFFVRKTP